MQKFKDNPGSEKINWSLKTEKSVLLENMDADCRFGLFGRAFFLLPLFSSQEKMTAIASKDSFFWYKQTWELQHFAL